jgi:hypothetical protein
MENPKIVKSFHLDHGIDQERAERLLGLEPLPEGFFALTRTLPEGETDLTSALYGPLAGDPPVPEEKVNYRQRTPDRPVSRLLVAPQRPTRSVTMIGISAPEGVTLFTMYGGALALREPGDASIANDPTALAESTEFWSKHALAVDG